MSITTHSLRPGARVQLDQLESHGTRISGPFRIYSLIESEPETYLVTSEVTEGDCHQVTIEPSAQVGAPSQN